MRALAHTKFTMAAAGRASGPVRAVPGIIHLVDYTIFHTSLTISQEYL